jgi:phenylpropionate dioxygenase-like ring-hydroxylating dioxygenase large terminal subunit
MNSTFLPAWLYAASEIAQRERDRYAPRLWHPLTASSAVADCQAQAFDLLGLPLLLTRVQGVARAFINRCPHRGVALQPSSAQPTNCRRLVCPYHGWTYDLQGQLLAAARESDFVEPFRRTDWPLTALSCRELGGLIWVAVGPDPLPLEQQLDLVLQEAEALFNRPRTLLLRQDHTLDCNWKIAHDNTLDDYHVAIAHPTTLHREQGPVRLYRHVLSAHGSLLATPYGETGEFLTFGLAPWTHLLLWPDGRLALIQFPPLDPGHCRMEVWLLGDAGLQPAAQAWMDEVQTFLAEDRRLVEAAQLGYASGLVPGPPHRLEQRILQQQTLYARLMDLAAMPAS